MLLQWLGEHRRSPALHQAAEAMELAVEKVLANPATRTRDIGGAIGTRAFAQSVVAAL